MMSFKVKYCSAGDLQTRGNGNHNSSGEGENKQEMLGDLKKHQGSKNKARGKKRTKKTNRKYVKLKILVSINMNLYKKSLPRRSMEARKTVIRLFRSETRVTKKAAMTHQRLKSWGGGA